MVVVSKSNNCQTTKEASVISNPFWNAENNTQSNYEEHHL